MNQKELKWGETPFDQMTHEELLVHTKRMFSALQSAHNELHSARYMELQRFPNNNYWTGNGSGNRAYQKTQQALTKAMNGYEDENISRSYFRYVEGMLFDAWHGNDMTYWVICTQCGQLHGLNALGANETIGMKHTDIPHPDPNCQGVFRRMTLDDLKPIS